MWIKVTEHWNCGIQTLQKLLRQIDVELSCLSTKPRLVLKSRNLDNVVFFQHGLASLITF